MWLGPLSSASGRIVQIRRRLMNLILGPGHFVDFMSETPFVTPTVMHADTCHIPDAAAVAVGVGWCATSISPWSCPFLPEVYTAVAARQLLETRIDARSWIARLSGTTLVCNCRREARYDCWAWLLRSLFIERFDSEREESDTDEVPFEDLDVEDEDAFETYVSYKDEVEATADELGVPRHVPWPASWSNLVESIRQLNPSILGNICGLGNTDAGDGWKRS